MSFADNQNHTLTPPKRMYCRRYSPVLRDQILFIAEREGRMGDLEDFEGIKVLCKCQSWQGNGIFRKNQSNVLLTISFQRSF